MKSRIDDEISALNKELKNNVGDFLKKNEQSTEGVTNTNLDDEDQSSDLNNDTDDHAMEDASNTPAQDHLIHETHEIAAVGNQYDLPNKKYFTDINASAREKTETAFQAAKTEFTKLLDEINHEEIRAETKAIQQSLHNIYHVLYDNYNEDEEDKINYKHLDNWIEKCNEKIGFLKN
ncbi:MAG: hypothetical protein JO149_08015, partial [Gammaproteobacteria bacterium]|nr:hypothetical protein [Gammaproteobacteria bacterium]